MRVCLMIEGQEGVAWEEWVALARVCEEVGLEGLFRSDHYSSPTGFGERGSLDAWATLAALGALTERIRLGTLVSPVTFRHPSALARAVVTADYASGGRVELGIGAGWMELEHASNGFPFPPLRVRLELLAEQLEVVHRQWTEPAFDFVGSHYCLEDCRALPKPLQQPRPPLIVGGSAARGTADPAARFADEYNTIFASPEECRRRRRALDEACERAGRAPRTLRFSLMTGCVVGSDRSELRERVRARIARTGQDLDLDDYVRERADSFVLGTAEEAVEQLRRLEQAGVERVFLQHLVHDDLDMVRLLGAEVAPAVS